MKTQHQQGTRQKLIRQIVTWVLIVKLGLFGVQAENRIQQGESPVEVLIWLLNQCVPVLQQLNHQEKEQNKDNHK